MKIKNTTTRNISLLAPHSPNKGMPFRLLIPAETTMEFEDSEYMKVMKAGKHLVSKGLLKIVERVESKLTSAQIADRVARQTGNTIKVEGKTKQEVQKQAEAMGVEV